MFWPYSQGHGSAVVLILKHMSSDHRLVHDIDCDQSLPDGFQRAQLASGILAEYIAPRQMFPSEKAKACPRNHRWFHLQALGNEGRGSVSQYKLRVIYTSLIPSTDIGGSNHKDGTAVRGDMQSLRGRGREGGKSQYERGG